MTTARTEIELVNLAKGHDESAMAELYEMTYARLYASIRGVLRNEADAEDVLQDSYISAFIHLDTLQDADKFQPWLYRIAMNNCKNYLKKKKPALFTDLKGEDDADVDFVDDRDTFSPERQMDLTDTIEIFDRMFDRLPEDQKICIVMFYRDEMSVAEIAEYLDISEGTVKSRLYYGRKKIQAEVEDMEKKGVKLYSAMPFLGWMLHKQMSDIVATASIPSASSVMTAVQNASAGAGVGTSSANTVVTFSVAEEAASVLAVGNVTTNVAKAAGLFAKIGTGKLIMGIIAAVIVVGTVTGGVWMYNSLTEGVQNIHDSDTKAEDSLAEYDKGLDAKSSEHFYQLLKNKIDRLGTLKQGDIFSKGPNFKGVGDAMLIDFNGDGNDELFLYYRDVLSENPDSSGYIEPIDWFHILHYPPFSEEVVYLSHRALVKAEESSDMLPEIIPDYYVRIYRQNGSYYVVDGPYIEQEGLKFYYLSFNKMDSIKYENQNIDIPEFLKGAELVAEFNSQEPYTEERANRLQNTLDELERRIHEQ